MAATLMCATQMHGGDTRACVSAGELATPTIHTLIFFVGALASYLLKTIPMNTLSHVTGLLKSLHMTTILALYLMLF